MKVVVLGGGPGGIQSTRTIRMGDDAIDVTVIRPESHSVIYCVLPYVIEGVVEKSSVRKTDELVTGVGATLVRDIAVEVNFDKRVVETEKSGSFPYDKLIIATGADPFIPGIPGSDLKNIYTFKTERDLEKILDCLEKKPEKAVVIGAGNIGVEMSVAFRERGLKTYLIEMRDRVMPNLLDGDLALYPSEEIKELGVDVRLNTAVTSLEGREYVEKVLLDSGESIEVGENDLVVFSVGVRPNSAIFENSRLEMTGDGIVVDSRMKCNIDDVYAVGDCASYLSLIDQKSIGGKLATNAVPMAKIAAYTILGRDVEYPGFVNGAVSKVVEWRMGGTGFTEEVARQRGFDVVSATGETTTRFPMIPGAKRAIVKLVAEKESGRILGGQAVAGESVPNYIDVITYAIQMRSDIHDLFRFSYCAQPYQTFFPARNAIVQAAEELVSKIGS